MTLFANGGGLSNAKGDGVGACVDAGAGVTVGVDGLGAGAIGEGAVDVAGAGAAVGDGVGDTVGVKVGAGVTSVGGAQLPQDLGQPDMASPKKHKSVNVLMVSQLKPCTTKLSLSSHSATGSGEGDNDGVGVCIGVGDGVNSGDISNGTVIGT